MSTVPGLFTDEAERVAAALSAIEAQLPLLRAGWEGPAADIFFADMERDAHPALARLVHALRYGSDVSAVMLRVLDDAEQAAARIDWSGGGVATSPLEEDISTPAGSAMRSVGSLMTHADALDALDASEDIGVADDGAEGAGQVAVVSAEVTASMLGAPEASPGGNGDASTATQEEEVPSSAAARSERYGLWSEVLRRLGPPYSGIRFFDAAAHVTSLLGLAEGGVPLTALATMQVFGTLNGAAPDFAGANVFLERVGRQLFLLNLGIYKRLLFGEMITEDDLLISPIAGQLGYPEDLTVESTLHFDIHMVILEQETLTAIVVAIPPTDEQIHAINWLLNVEDSVRVGDGAVDDFISSIFSGAADTFSGDTQFVEWAVGHTGGPIDFTNEEQRIAMGVARVFQEHGLSQEDYNTYMQQMFSSREDGSAPPAPGPPMNPVSAD